MEDREALLAEHAEAIGSSLPLDTGNTDHEEHPLCPRINRTQTKIKS